MAKHIIIKDTTGEYIAAYITAENNFFVMNITAQIDDTDVNADWDDTNSGWAEISEDEMSEMLDSCTIIAEAEKDF